MSNLIRPNELRTLLDDATVRIVDTRFDLADISAGERAYGRSHIPGAAYAHLDRDLSGPLGEHGGRHPLPDPAVLSALLGRLGIGNESQVVVYDGGNGMFASRLWWLLRYLGHDRVRVLDGGFAAWLEAGYPVEMETPRIRPSSFEPTPRPEMLVSREHVLRNLENPGVTLVDARAAERFSGEVEPIDPKAGHIPSAINLPFADNLERGRFKAATELRRRFEQLEQSEELVVYCGSGVSAAHDLLAMEEGGLRGAKLYPGSWSDWCSYQDAPVATGPDA